MFSFLSKASTIIESIQFLKFVTKTMKIVDNDDDSENIENKFTEQDKEKYYDCHRNIDQ